MAEQLHRVQLINLPTLVPRPPVPEPKGPVQAATAGGASTHQRHPDLPAQAHDCAQCTETRANKSRIGPPPPIDPPTGPPPAFDANVLEVQARGRRFTVETQRGAKTIPDPVVALERQWQVPAAPEPALINLQL